MRPENNVAYDSDHRRAAEEAPADRAFFKDDGLGYGYYPAALGALAKTSKGRMIGGRILFMHERISPGGHRRLVVVSGPTDQALDFQRQAIGPARWFGSITIPPFNNNIATYINTATMPLGPDDKRIDHMPRGATTQKDLKRDDQFYLKTPLRIFLGRPDPKDASHFTIRYEVGVQPGVIDGWLGDDDAIRMKATGPWSMPPRS